eukprot:1401670-Amphidinium_carterae.1
MRTLSARSGPILRYVKWCQATNRSPFPVEEQDVYDYLSTHRDSLSPSAPSSLLEAFRFMGGVLQFDGAMAAVDSPRVKGFAAKIIEDVGRQGTFETSTCSHGSGDKGA